jgi:hypothetical protein
VRRALFFALLVPGTLFALDFGLLIRQNPLFGTPEVPGDGFAEYSASALPWASVPLGEGAELYASAGLGIRYNRFDWQDEGREWSFLPEIGRLELSLRPSPDLGLELGRFAFSDPSSGGLVFSSLFDGIGTVWNTGGTRLKAGAFYTGLLYKKSAYIIMTNSDLADYHKGDVYFASRRLAFALNWEAASFLDTRSQVDLGVLAQIDLNDTEDTLHSQYLLARWRRSLGRGWYADLGTILEVEERNRKEGLGFALYLSPFLVPAGRPGDRLFFNARFASGNWNDTMRSFKPVTAGAQGRILRARFSALSLLELGYSALLFPRLEGEAAAAYFFRTDRETYYDHDMDSSSRSPALGGEISARLTWTPASWCGASLGFGVFLPQTGRAYEGGAETKWLLDAGLTLSF